MFINYKHYLTNCQFRYFIHKGHVLWFHCLESITYLPIWTLQIDLEYRKQWDNMVIKLEKVDKDEETKSEVVQWITHYPVSKYAVLPNIL